METLLLVDDDADGYHIMREILAMLGVAVCCEHVHDARGATRYLSNKVPDYISVDKGLPPTGGGMVSITMLKQRPGLAGVTIILSTDILDGATSGLALAAGASACIQKTFSLPRLAGDLRGLL